LRFPPGRYSYLEAEEGASTRTPQADAPYPTGTPYGVREAAQSASTNFSVRLLSVPLRLKTLRS